MVLHTLSFVRISSFSICKIADSWEKVVCNANLPCSQSRETNKCLITSKKNRKINNFKYEKYDYDVELKLVLSNLSQAIILSTQPNPIKKVFHYHGGTETLSLWDPRWKKYSEILCHKSGNYHYSSMTRDLACIIKYITPVLWDPYFTDFRLYRILLYWHFA